MRFICAYMEVTTQLELYLHEQTQIVASAACIVGSQQFLTCFLTFIVIPLATCFIMAIYF